MLPIPSASDYIMESLHFPQVEVAVQIIILASVAMRLALGFEQGSRYAVARPAGKQTGAQR